MLCAAKKVPAAPTRDVDFVIDSTNPRFRTGDEPLRLKRCARHGSAADGGIALRELQYQPLRLTEKAE